MKEQILNFKNRVIIITGGLGLIGSGISKKFAALGGTVIICDPDERKALSFVSKIKRETSNKNIFFRKCDITNSTEIDTFINYVKDRFGSIDILVNSAYPRGKTYGTDYEHLSYEDFCENTNLHLGGYFLATKQISLMMKKQRHGKIVNIASIYGVVAPTFGLYQSTSMTSPLEYSVIKSGIIQFTRYLASYLGPYGVQVNAVSPGGVYNNQPVTFVKRYCQKVPLGRMANPEDIVGGIIFLASPLSDYITGHNLMIDGGYSIC